ncbi:MAG: redoxin domain-containing protein [Myxococcales bacterium]|nr:redoxin domain-containing protein [Myxococcales bacterium]
MRARWPRWAGPWLVALLALGCGGPAAHAGPPEGAAQEALAATQALQRQMTAMERRLDDQARRLAAVERRAGLVPLRPSAVDPWPGADAISLPRTLRRVDGPGAKAQRGRPEPQGPYVLAFWATWCKPCTSPEELDRLRWLRRELRAEGLSLVSVAIDGLEKVQGDPRARTWLYPLWQGDDAHVDALPRAFIQATGMGLPLFAVVDGQGRLRYTRAKALDDEAVAELVTAARSLD